MTYPLPALAALRASRLTRWMTRLTSRVRPQSVPESHVPATGDIPFVASLDTAMAKQYSGSVNTGAATESALPTGMGERSLVLR